MERRKSLRNESENDIEILIDNKKIPAKIHNISEGGMLLRCCNTSDFNNPDNYIGQEINFTLLPELYSDIKTSGRIIRTVEDNDATFIAVFFL